MATCQRVAVGVGEEVGLLVGQAIRRAPAVGVLTGGVAVLAPLARSMALPCHTDAGIF